MSINEIQMDNALSLVKDAVEKGCFPGASVVIGHKDGVYRFAFYGNRCLYPQVLHVKENTLYDLASLTKVVATTTLFMIFMDKGLVSAYDKVSEYITGFEGEYKESVTLINLLTHTSGLPSHKPFYKICKDYEDTIRCILGLELEYRPGTEVQYSDLGFILLGYILEKVGGDSLDNLCSRYIFSVLGMSSTCFNPEDSNVAATEIDSESNQVIIGKCHDENGRFFGGVSGHAGVFSNASDLAKFANMLINKGYTNGKRILSPAAFDAMIRNYTSGLNENRGYGWCIKGNGLSSFASSGGDLVSPAAFGHTGFTGTSMWIDIERDVYVVLLTNRVHPSRNNTGILRFRRLFHNAVLSSIC